MFAQLRPVLSLLVLFTLLLGVAFPLGLVGVGRLAFPTQAGGSLIERDGHVIGSSLLGQNFTAEKYFWSRPSATTDTDPADPSKTVPAPYNAAGSAASNLAPTSKALIDRVTADVAKLGGGPVPGDSVTTSASGLDPNISPEFAAHQVARVAKARNLSEDRVRQVVAANTEGRLLGVIGEPRVNVLQLNLALDALPGQPSAAAR